MQDNEIKWSVGARVWPRFPKRAALLVFFVSLLIIGPSQESFPAVSLAAGTWIAFTTLRLLYPAIYKRDVWNTVGMAVIAVATWPTWVLSIFLVLFGLGRGIDAAEYLFILGPYLAAWIVEGLVFRSLPEQAIQA